MKLTQRQQIVLKAIQNGERVIYVPYQGRFNPNAYYDVSSVGKCTREIKKLIDIGFLKEEQSGYGRSIFNLTEDGKNFKCEIDEPYEVWCVDWHFSSIKVDKYKGYLDGSKLTLENGQIERENNTRSFFDNRNDAFAFALKKQKEKINTLKSKVKNEQKYLETLLNHRNNPDLDKPGYL